MPTKSATHRLGAEVRFAYLPLFTIIFLHHHLNFFNYILTMAPWESPPLSPQTEAQCPTPIPLGPYNISYQQAQRGGEIYLPSLFQVFPHHHLIYFFNYIVTITIVPWESLPLSPQTEAATLAPCPFQAHDISYQQAQRGGKICLLSPWLHFFLHCNLKCTSTLYCMERGGG